MTRRFGVAKVEEVPLFLGLFLFIRRKNMFDVAVIGGGVVGGLIFRALTSYDMKVCLVEKEPDVSTGASGANSGIVHAGFDAVPGSQKAKFNVLGAKMMKEVCRQLSVEYKNNGAFVIGYSDEEKRTLLELKERGEINGVSDLEVIDQDALRKYLPSVSERATCALFAKSSAIVCPYSLAIASIGNAMDNGGELFREFKVVDVKKDDEGFTLMSEKGKEVRARYVVNAAGIYSDYVASLFGEDGFKIRARKGEYYLLDKSVAGICPYTVFTCPTEKGKGILVSQTADGNLILGPTAEFCEKGDTSTTHVGLKSVADRAKDMINGIDFSNIITSFSGLRAVSEKGDFTIERSSACKGLFNVVGVESPGLTSAPAIAEYVAGEVASDLGRGKNESFDPTRKPYSVKGMKREERNELISKNPAYGEIVCRCETVSLGEIEDAIHRNPGAVTVDGVKRRVRAGMGRCQGGFCQGKILELLKSSLGVSEYEIRKKGGNSYILEKIDD